jgi:hypothetical protein|eukprot:COSAG01_NODE_1557_length_9928_cov_7.869977_10_plen_61_part_00
MTCDYRYTLKSLAIGLMETSDPRIPDGTMGVGPPWQYVAEASQYAKRQQQARPIASHVNY